MAGLRNRGVVEGEQVPARVLLAQCWPGGVVLPDGRPQGQPRFSPIQAMPSQSSLFCGELPWGVDSNGCR